jgi:uncharacterized protein (TIGR02594 family)
MSACPCVCHLKNPEFHCLACATSPRASRLVIDARGIEAVRASLPLLGEVAPKDTSGCCYQRPGGCEQHQGNGAGYEQADVEYVSRELGKWRASTDESLVTTWERVERLARERMREAVEPAWLGVAWGEVGQREVAGKEHNPRVLEYHAGTTLKAKADEVAWCSSFVDWCMKRAGEKGTGSAAAASWCAWGVECEPRLGAVVVIHSAAAAGSSLTTSGNHVGLLLGESATHWRLLGGNQGDSVKVSAFPKEKWALKACRWPGRQA